MKHITMLLSFYETILTEDYINHLKFRLSPSTLGPDTVDRINNGTTDGVGPLEFYNEPSDTVTITVLVIDFNQYLPQVIPFTDYLENIVRSQTTHIEELIKKSAAQFKTKGEALYGTREIRQELSRIFEEIKDHKRESSRERLKSVVLNALDNIQSVIGKITGEVTSLDKKPPKRSEKTLTISYNGPA